MKRQVAVLSVALAVTIVGVAVVSSNAQQPGPPTGTLQLVALPKDDRFTFVNNPPKQGPRRPPSPGDFGVLRHTKVRNPRASGSATHAWCSPLRGGTGQSPMACSSSAGA